ncbi:VPLPA-CTERM sorting domain-containing protein (plasmid) [Methylomonas sp. 2BW1-5-20]|uniref:VPLPA-CTERM sorting domain-containing protein n=1 Tax=Methylomonas sp. 2BW1-5-20 TaxID=3376686 RepID=UPI00404BCAAC
MKLKNLPAIVAVLASITATNGAFAAVTENHVFFDPTSTTVNLGDTFSLVLKGELFPAGLDGGSVDVNFDSSMLHADTVSVNSSLWNFASVPGAIDNTTGKIEFTDFAQFGANTTNNLFNIATFTFTAIGSGSSQITLVTNNNDPFATGGNPITPTFSNAEVNILQSAVPLPAAFWLFLSGLGSFAALGRRGA